MMRRRANDMIAVIWGYDAAWPNSHGVKAVKYWCGLGFPVVTLSWNNKRNIYGHAILAKRAAEFGLPCRGTMGSNWPGDGDGDIVATASAAWRTPRPNESNYIIINNLE